ncbi:hypothetical protein KAT63_04045 [Candidatus Parcubacteria bacterium]|nr:hypothetical protein [Candidatus Parcubacteria bacterium]
MNQLLLKCKACGKIFSSGIVMSPGSSATFINNKSQCIYCGSMENIPDGTFRSTVEGFIKILEDSGNPVQKAKELLEELQKNKTSDDLLKTKKSFRFSKYKKLIPSSRKDIAIYISIISVLIQLWKGTPDIHVEYDVFVNQYNQNIDIKVENNFISINNK